jgi:hypothetical protein
MATFSRATNRTLHTGSRLHRIAVQLPASSAWQDTGLQPDVLATRPLLAGYSVRLMWDARVQPGVEIQPIIHLRYVPDPSLATRDRTFRYEPTGPAPEVGAPLAEVRLVTGARMRFPREPGRIEARIAGASGPTELFAVAGTIRLELFAHRAGDGDSPLRAPLDHMGLVVGSDEFPELPRLPAVEEPIDWHTF